MARHKKSPCDSVQQPLKEAKKKLNSGATHRLQCPMMAPQLALGALSAINATKLSLKSLLPTVNPNL
jgi:hypothetical protein